MVKKAVHFFKEVKSIINSSYYTSIYVIQTCNQSCHFLLSSAHIWMIRKQHCKTKQKSTKYMLYIYTKV